MLKHSLKHSVIINVVYAVFKLMFRLVTMRSCRISLMINKMSHLSKVEQYICQLDKI